MNLLLIASCLIVLLGAGCGSAQSSVPYEVFPTASSTTSVSDSDFAKAPTNRESRPVSPALSDVDLPLDRAGERVTKKSFGTYVRPGDSPISPERFNGYHAGTDFETFEDEQDHEVEIRAICEGTLAAKKVATGYGGVIVQRCTLHEQPVTVIYGHMRLESVTAKIGDLIKRDDRLGVLGRGYSRETDGERKHLHLGIHKGAEITIQGYVSSKTDLASWLDAEEALPL